MDLHQLTDLKEFTKAALTGLCSNPVVMDPQYQKQARGAGVTTESMAVGIAYTTLEQLNAIVKRKTEEENGTKIIPINP